MSRALFLKLKLHLLDYPQGLWGRMNKEQLRGLWKEIGSKNTGRTLEAALQAIIKYYVVDDMEKGIETNYL